MEKIFNTMVNFMFVTAAFPQEKGGTKLILSVILNKIHSYGGGGGWWDLMFFVESGFHIATQMTNVP